MRWYFQGMRSTWPYLAGVVAIGIGLGTWIAGIPTSSAGITVADGASGTGGANTVPLLPTSSFPAITITPTTPPPRYEDPATSVPTTLEPETTVAATTTAAPETTLAPATTPPVTTPPETVPPSTAPTELVDRSAVRLVLANGDGRYNLVGRNVDRLLPLGYTEIDQTDIRNVVERTVLYVRPGFEDEAVRLAADLLVPAALIEPLPATPVTINDELGDIVVVLGPDAVR